MAKKKKPQLLLLLPPLLARLTNSRTRRVTSSKTHKHTNATEEKSHGERESARCLMKYLSMATNADCQSQEFRTNRKRACLPPRAREETGHKNAPNAAIIEDRRISSALVIARRRRRRGGMLHTEREMICRTFSVTMEKLVFRVRRFFCCVADLSLSHSRAGASSGWSRKQKKVCENEGRKEGKRVLFLCFFVVGEDECRMLLMVPGGGSSGNGRRFPGFPAPSTVCILFFSPPFPRPTDRPTSESLYSGERSTIAFSSMHTCTPSNRVFFFTIAETVFSNFGSKQASSVKICGVSAASSVPPGCSRACVRACVLAFLKCRLCQESFQV
jgi:hypothetical protein